MLVNDAIVLIGLVQAGPVILSSRDIGDNYYDAPPPVILERTAWLGRFIEAGKPDQKVRESRLVATHVTFALQKEPGGVGGVVRRAALRDPLGG